jgi:hypothetical protein
MAALNEQIDARLLRAIWACAREHRVDGEALHEAIQAGFQKTSLKQLTRREAYRLLDGLRGKRDGGIASRRWAQGNHGRRNIADRTEHLVNQRELQMLREAAALRGWTEETLQAFVRRQIKAEMIHTMQQFNKVFWALKAMNRRDGLAREE